MVDKKHYLCRKDAKIISLLIKKLWWLWFNPEIFTQISESGFRDFCLVSKNRSFFILHLAKLEKTSRRKERFSQKKPGRSNFHFFQDRSRSPIGPFFWGLKFPLILFFTEVCNFCDIFSKNKKPKSSLGMLTK